METGLPDYTLRGHTVPITGLIVVYHNNIDGSNSNTSVPKLISTDENGKLIIWDLITRRSVATISISEGMPITYTELVDNKYLVCLSKDYMLRILDWQDLKKSQPLFEMRVNTMNFANFTISVDSKHEELMLCCCNTKDSDTIDIYQIHTWNWSLSRIFNHLDFYPILKSTLEVVLDELPDKLGMIMKFERDPQINVNFIGFESGILVGFQVDKTDHRLLKIIYLSTVHYPEPILDIHVVHSGNVLTSSTNNIIASHHYKIPQESFQRIKIDNMYRSRDFSNGEPELIQAKGMKIGYISSFRSHLVWSTWKGKTFIKDVDKNIMTKYSRVKSSIRPDESSESSVAHKPRASNDQKYVKLGAIAVFEGSHSDLMDQSRQLVVMNRSKLKRFNEFISKSWCFIGYRDGTIALHKIKD